MKMIILAAGEGKRLRPLTNDKPKCMVEYQGKPIIESILSVAKECDVKDISIITGYKENILRDYLKEQLLTFFVNPEYMRTNMVTTLFKASKYMDDDVIISYADIIYKKEVLESLINCKHDFCVVIDKRWKKLWEQRMADPLSDAETLKIKDGKVYELGKKPKNYEEIEGQYIGLIKISKNIINTIIEFYNSLDRDALYDGNTFENMYMTSFIQLIIDKLLDVHPIFIEGGWLEVDCIEDLNSTMV